MTDDAFSRMKGLTETKEPVFRVSKIAEEKKMQPEDRLALMTDTSEYKWQTETDHSQFADKLAGLKATADIHVPAAEEETEMYAPVSSTKSMSASKRRSKAHMAGSALQVKERNAVRLEEAGRKWEKTREKSVKKVLSRFVGNRCSLGVDEMKSLSCFFQAGADDDNFAMVLRYCNGKRQALSVTGVMRNVFQKFMELDIGGLDLSTDETFSKCAARLEDISEKSNAIEFLIRDNPGFWDSLTDEQKELFRFKLAQTTLIRDYYFCRKDLITHPYYRSHYNSEIGTYTDGGVSDESVIASKIGLVQMLGIRLKKGPDASETDIAARIKSLDKEKEWRTQLGLYYGVQREDTAFNTGMGASMGFFMKIASWAMRKKRTTDHGASRYRECAAKLSMLPDDFREMEKRGPMTQWKRGDAGTPAIDLASLYVDPHKDALRQLHSAAPADAADALYSTALESMGNYLKVQGIVNRDTTEMEMAFIDTFIQSSKKWIEDYSKKSDTEKTALAAKYQALSQMLTKVETLAGGTLKADLHDDAQFAYIDSHTEGLVEDTTFMPNLEESNIAQIPLFLHTPGINDVKQSTIGDCWLMSAMTTLVKTNPQAITGMFQDMGDGNVIVRLYTAYSQDGKRVSQHADLAQPGITFQPEYFKLKKQYETGDGNAADCVWPQLLEKAYAVAGYAGTGKAKVKDGKIGNVAWELTNGMAATALMHMTGKPVENYYPELTDADTTILMKDIGVCYSLFAGIPRMLKDMYLTSLRAAKVPDASSMKLQIEMKSEGYTGKLENKFTECGAGLKAAGMSEDDIKTLLGSIAVKMGLTMTVDAADDGGMKVHFAKMGSIYGQRIMQNLDAMKNGTPITHDFIETEFFTEGRIDESLKELVSNAEQGLAIKEQLMAEGKSEAEAETDAKAATEMSLNQAVWMNFGDAQKNPDGIRDAMKKQAAEITAIRQMNDVTEEDGKSIDALFAEALMSRNPGKYCAGAMRFITKCSETFKAKGAVSVCIGHFLSAIDTKLVGDTWYVLIKDPFNIYNMEYHKSEDGASEVKTEEGFKKVLDVSYNTASRELVGTDEEVRLGGFRGISWWKLEDLYPMINIYVPFKG